LNPYQLIVTNEDSMHMNGKADGKTTIHN